MFVQKHTIQRIRFIVAICALALLAVACSQVAAVEKTTSSTATPAPTATMTTPADEPLESQAQDVVAQALSDLQGRLAVRAQEIVVQDVTPTDFSDASLGVPEPGKVYAQMLTPGYVIRLAVSDQVYIYHGNSERVALAAQDSKQVIAVPDDQPTPPRPSTPTYHRSPQGPPNDWSAFRDDRSGFELSVPADWTWKELPSDAPGMPENWPVVRIVHFYPQAWDAEINRSGPPDPTAKVVVAPVQMEVLIGPERQFRRVYPEPTQRQEIEIGGMPVTVEKEIFDPMFLTRYVFASPADPELYVTLTDQFTGFPERLADNEAIVDQVSEIVQRARFVE